MAKCVDYESAEAAWKQFHLPTFSVVLNLRGRDGSGRLLRVDKVWWHQFLGKMLRKYGPKSR